VHRADEADVIDDLRRVRQQFAQPDAVLPALRELELARATGNFACPAVMPVMRWPMRIDAGIPAR
jgi:hypothetical protein